jgi:hypothetical protein
MLLAAEPASLGREGKPVSVLGRVGVQCREPPLDRDEGVSEERDAADLAVLGGLPRWVSIANDDVGIRLVHLSIRQAQGHELAGAQAGADRELDERVERGRGASDDRSLLLRRRVRPRLVGTGLGLNADADPCGVLREVPFLRPAKHGSDDVEAVLARLTRESFAREPLEPLLQVDVADGANGH